MGSSVSSFPAFMVVAVHVVVVLVSWGLGGKYSVIVPQDEEQWFGDGRGISFGLGWCEGEM